MQKFDTSTYPTMQELVNSNYFKQLHAILNHYDTILYDILHFDKTHGVMINKEVIIRKWQLVRYMPVS
jgi:hypothetical protein